MRPRVNAPLAPCPLCGLSRPPSPRDYALPPCRPKIFCLRALVERAIQGRVEPHEALVALNLIEHVGPIRLRQLLEHFGEAPEILRASRQQLLQVRNIGEETAEAIANWEKTIDLN